MADTDKIPDEIPEKTILGFKKNVFYLSMVSLLNDAASEIIYPLLAIFLNTVLGASYAIIGLIEGIVEGTASLTKLVSGWLSDRLEKNKVFIFVGYSLSVFMRPLVGFASAVWQVLAFRFADRIGKGVRTAPRDALIANSINEDERGKSFGFHRAMDHLGAVIGALLAFVLVWIFSATDPGKFHRLQYVFAFAFIPGIASLYLIVKKVRDTKPQEAPENIGEEQEEEEPTQKVKLTLKGMDGRFKIFLLILALFTLGNSTDAFLLLRVHKIGISAPLIWAVFHIIKSTFSTPAGIISDKVGRKGVIIVGWLIYSVVYFGFAFTKNHNAIWVLFMLYGVYYALTEGVAKALIADYSPAELRGTAFGWYHLVEGGMLIPASILFGVFWRYVAGWFAFSFGAALALTSVVLFIIFVPGKSESGTSLKGTPADDSPDQRNDEGQSQSLSDSQL